jgi:oxygen-independent coproporphyrinogen-3 oxidase
MSTLSFYIHIPYCVRRCGYCDFNTYTPSELSITSELSKISKTYLDLVLQEIGFARSQSSAISVPTIFFGGGTPTLMSPTDLGRALSTIYDLFDVEPDAEITIEANPDSVSKEGLSELRELGFNRISFGMQSAVPHVLASLDRTHNPDNVMRAVNWAKESGFEELSVDLIYGVPGESVSDWKTSIEAALSLPITHISAYALIVEDGTKLAHQVRRGTVIIPDDDQTADKYLLADELLESAGFQWYELSNWSKPGSESRHNLRYWNGENWWGAGPGAHSHIDGRRFWNVKHPDAYAQRLLETGDPKADEEYTELIQRWNEELMLKIRLAGGISQSFFSPDQVNSLSRYRDEGFLDDTAWSVGNVVLSRTGRLIADRIVREIAM